MNGIVEKKLNNICFSLYLFIKPERCNEILFFVKIELDFVSFSILLSIIRVVWDMAIHNQLKKITLQISSQLLVGSQAFLISEGKAGKCQLVCLFGENIILNFSKFVTIFL